MQNIFLMTTKLHKPHCLSSLTIQIEISASFSLLSLQIRLDDVKSLVFYLTVVSSPSFYNIWSCITLHLLSYKYVYLALPCRALDSMIFCGLAWGSWESLERSVGSRQVTGNRWAPARSPTSRCTRLQPCWESPMRVWTHAIISNLLSNLLTYLLRWTFINSPKGIQEPLYYDVRTWKGCLQRTRLLTSGGDSSGLNRRSMRAWPSLL